jgi:viologen exporter family transport system permease protein
MSSHGDPDPTVGGLRHGAEIAAVQLRTTLHNELQYRTNFVVQLFQTATEVVVGLVVVMLVFAHTTELNGWHRADLLAAIGVFMVIGGLIRALVYPPLEAMMNDVARGDFDYTLTQPADAQLLVSVRGPNLWQLSDTVVGAIIIAVAVPDLSTAVDVAGAASFVALLACGVVIAYCMWLSLCCVVFWVVQAPFMDSVLYFATRAAQYPISIYPAWLRVSLTVVIPLGIAVTAPSEAITSKLSWITITSAIAVTVVLTLFSRWIWTRALRRYSGASA